MDVQVTQAHINRGLPGEPGYCPIALAVVQAFKAKYGVKPFEVTVDWLHIGVGGNGLGHCYWNLQARQTDLEGDGSPADKQFVRRFIEGFDKGEDVQPFTFALPLDIEGQA
jgi:hypothetical protein